MEKIMCVALPGKVIKMNDKEALVDFNGNRVTARAGLVDVKPGDYCLVHAGCILQKVLPDEAADLTELMKEMEAFS